VGVIRLFIKYFYNVVVINNSLLMDFYKNIFILRNIKFVVSEYYIIIVKMILR